MKKENIILLKKTVSKKYSNPEEIEEQIKDLNAGISKSEKRIISGFFDKKKAKAKARILVVGCGVGRESGYLKKLGFDVYGIDISEDLIKKAKELIKGTYFSNQDASSTSFKDNYFDYIVMFNQVLEHIPGKEERIKTLNELYRITKKEGILIITAHNRDYSFSSRKNIFMSYLKNKILCLLSGKSSELEYGDLLLSNVSNASSKGKCFGHIYSLKELLNEIKSQTQFKILKVLNKDSLEENSKILNRKSNYMFYVLKKN